MYFVCAGIGCHSFLQIILVLKSWKENISDLLKMMTVNLQSSSWLITQILWRSTFSIYFKTRENLFHIKDGSYSKIYSGLVGNKVQWCNSFGMKFVGLDEILSKIFFLHMLLNDHPKEVACTIRHMSWASQMLFRLWKNMDGCGENQSSSSSLCM